MRRSACHRRLCHRAPWRSSRRTTGGPCRPTSSCRHLVSRSTSLPILCRCRMRVKRANCQHMIHCRRICRVRVDKTLTVAHHTREITMEEALQQRTYRDALAGKRMAAREVVKWIMKREAWLAEHEPKASDLAFNRFRQCRCGSPPSWDRGAQPRSSGLAQRSGAPPA